MSLPYVKTALGRTNNALAVLREKLASARDTPYLIHELALIIRNHLVSLVPKSPVDTVDILGDVISGLEEAKTAIESIKIELEARYDKLAAKELYNATPHQ